MNFDLTGHRYGKLTVISKSAEKKHGYTCWLCRCDCSKEKVLSTGALRNKAHPAQSCGCSARDPELIKRKIDHFRKHGMAHHPVYSNWRGIMKRCFSVNHDSYSRYGGIGIKPCGYIAASPRNLLAHIGERPSPQHSVDRINGTEGYNCGQCEECLSAGRINNLRWATKSEQSRNMKSNHVVEIDGIKKCVVEWAEAAGLDPGLIYARLSNGWSGRRLICPADKGRNITIGKLAANAKRRALSA